MRDLTLLPREALIKTNPVDEADWNFRPLLGWIQRKRFQLTVELLGAEHYHRLLEIGYGSGVFLTEIVRHCDELYGIDPHPMNQAVMDVLARRGVMAQLFSGDAATLPFDDHMFDCIVSVSAMEFVTDLEAACGEIRRVLTPEGVVVVVTPGTSALVDLGLKILTGKSAKDDFGNRRESVVPTLRKHFVIQRELQFPALTGSLVRMYTGLRLALAPHA